jgi:4-alpha-glucanotransferase
MAKDRYGIDEGYHDARGTAHVTTPETRAALLAAMGVDAAEAAAPASSDTEPQPVRLVVRGSASPDGAGADEPGGDLILEDGTRRTLERGQRLPDDLPLGYHRLYPRGGGDTLVIVAPPHCHLPADLKTWGFAAQLYAARSRASWGIGDLADLAQLGGWTRRLGGGALMVNPLTAATPVRPIEPSPYYPSSRRYRNPLFLRMEDLPGWQGLAPELRARLGEAGRALNGARRIDRDAIFALKTEGLEALYARFTGDADFDRYTATEGRALTEFATYCALAERHGKDWRVWPEPVRRPDGAEIATFRAAHAARVRFHAWVQWLIDGQLARASRDVAIIHDLPIGLDVAGADAWCWQEMLARDVSVGAPPDEFAADGQDWGLTPFIPFRLRAAQYRPFVETIRASLRHAGGLRIDHVMGLFRLFWIPRALGARHGTYVRGDADELLAIVALESQRANALIVGEDLGNVEGGVRERLAAQRMLSYRLLYFEPTPPPQFPELALASVTTHDLATIAGLWTGADVAAQERVGVDPNAKGMAALKEKLRKLAGLAEDAPVEAAIEATHRVLAGAPSRVLLATLDDAVAVPERPNLPGTVTQWPNWSLALPQPLEEIEAQELPRRIAAALARG